MQPNVTDNPPPLTYESKRPADWRSGLLDCWAAPGENNYPLLLLRGSEKVLHRIKKA